MRTSTSPCCAPCQPACCSAWSSRSTSCGGSGQCISSITASTSPLTIGRLPTTSSSRTLSIAGYGTLPFPGAFPLVITLDFWRVSLVCMLMRGFKVTRGRVQGYCGVILQAFNEASMQFQRKMIANGGLGNETYLPPCAHSAPCTSLRCLV